MRLAKVMLVGLLALGAGCDPIHNNDINALGGETPGVRRGPLHRPGQPCQVCHDGAIGDPQEFSVAGTVFLTQGSLNGAEGVSIVLVDSLGRSPPEPPTTNAAGNFYLTPREYTPAYPITVSVGTSMATAPMRGPIGRDGSCGSCHTDPAGPESPGHVYLTLDSGQAPP